VGGTRTGNARGFTPPLTPPHQGEGDPVAQASWFALYDVQPSMLQQLEMRRHLGKGCRSTLAFAGSAVRATFRIIALKL